MPKNYESMLYTVLMITVLVANTIFNALSASPAVNNSGAIGMSVVLAVFAFYVIYRSLKFVDTRKKHIVLWGGILINAIGSIIFQIILQPTNYYRFAILPSILVAFVVHYGGLKVINSSK